MAIRIFSLSVIFAFIPFSKTNSADLTCDGRINKFDLPDSSVSVGALDEVRSLYEADQADRKALESFISSGMSSQNKKESSVLDSAGGQNYGFLGVDSQQDIIQRVQKNDQERESIVLDMLKKGRIRSSEELYFAAFILQHAQCSQLTKAANRLAELAVRRGDDKAKWLYAATLDRYLLSLGQPQKYGTQFTLQNGRKVLRPVDPSTTDADRAKYNVPPLSKALGDVTQPDK